MKKQVTYAVLVVVTLMTASVVHAAPIVSTFDTNADGWKVVDINYDTGLGATPVIRAEYAADWDGGHIYKVDPNLTDTYLFAAPAKFLGNQSGAYGQTLSWDIFNYNNGTKEIGLILTGGGHTLYRKQMVGPDGLWKHFDITLQANPDWVYDSPNGLPATNAQIAGVLSALNGLFIMGDWLVGNDMASLDNVTLNSVPEPASMGLLALGALALTRRRRVQF